MKYSVFLILLALSIMFADADGKKPSWGAGVLLNLQLYTNPSPPHQQALNLVSWEPSTGVWKLVGNGFGTYTVGFFHGFDAASDRVFVSLSSSPTDGVLATVDGRSGEILHTVPWDSRRRFTSKYVDGSGLVGFLDVWDDKSFSIVSVDPSTGVVTTIKEYTGRQAGRSALRPGDDLTGYLSGSFNGSSFFLSTFDLRTGENLHEATGVGSFTRLDYNTKTQALITADWYDDGATESADARHPVDARVGWSRHVASRAANASWGLYGVDTETGKASSLQTVVAEDVSGGISVGATAVDDSDQLFFGFFAPGPTYVPTFYEVDLSARKVVTSHRFAYGFSVLSMLWLPAAA